MSHQRTLRKTAEELTLSSKWGKTEFELRTGQVTALDDTNDTCTLYLSGETTTSVSNVKYLAPYRPIVNDYVWVLKNGTDVMVLNRKVWDEGGGRVIKGVHIIASATTTVPSGSTSRTLVSNFALTNIPVVNGRWYNILVKGAGQIATNTGEAFVITLKSGVTSGDGTDLHQQLVGNSVVSNSRIHWDFETLYKPGSTGTLNLCVAVNRAVSTATTMLAGTYGGSGTGHLYVQELGRGEVMNIIS